MPIVWPSGRALTIACVPLMPPAPGKFSITMGCPPSALLTAGLIVRVIVSTPEPGPTGRMVRSGLSDAGVCAATDSEPRENVTAIAVRAVPLRNLAEQHHASCHIVLWCRNGLTVRSVVLKRRRPFNRAATFDVLDARANGWHPGPATAGVNITTASRRSAVLGLHQQPAAATLIGVVQPFGTHGA